MTTCHFCNENEAVLQKLSWGNRFFPICEDCLERNRKRWNGRGYVYYVGVAVLPLDWKPGDPPARNYNEDMTRRATLENNIGMRGEMR